MKCSALKVLTLVVTSVGFAGCLKSDRRDTWILDNSRKFTWSVVERNIRSDKEDPAERAAEERARIDPLARKEYALTVGLAAAGGKDARSVLLHDARPYTVYSEAQFASLEELGKEIVRLSQCPGSAAVTRGDDGSITFQLSITPCENDKEKEGEDAKAKEAREAQEAASGEVLGGLINLEVILADGVFTAAKGMTFEADSDSARFDTKAFEGRDPKSTEPLEISWTWQPKAAAK